MVLVHGVGMNADYWGNITDALEPHFSLTVIDMPGHGHSPALPQPSPTLHQYTDVISRALQTVPPRPAIITGHSMGALIALDMAERHPQQVTGIAVLNGVYRRSEQASLAIRQRVAELTDQTASDPAATLERWFGTSPQGELAQASEQCREWLGNINQQSYAAAYRAFANADAPSDEALTRIDCPALFMTGELEPNSTPAMSQAMNRLLKNSQCVIVEQAKHMMSMTHPQAVVSALIKGFTED